MLQSRFKAIFKEKTGYWAGVQWAVSTKMKQLFALGYEMQKYERLKSHSNQYFEAEFKEQLNHNSVSVKIGALF